MNIIGKYDIDEILKELEAALQVDGRDYEERNLDIVINNVKTRIERQYNLDLKTYKANDAELEMSQSRNACSLFMDNMTRIHSKLSGYAHICRYLTNTIVSLANINYLGYKEDTLVKMLDDLQRKRFFAGAKESLLAVKMKLSTINMCREKRLFVLLIVTEELGLPELTACIAEILKMGSF